MDATTPMGVTGPAAGSPEMKMEGKSEVIGTLANCGGGVTPWNTVLTCEENFQDYYGQRTDDQGQPGQGTDDAPEALWRSPRLTAGSTTRAVPSPPSTTAGSWRSTLSTRTPSRASIPGSDASGTRTRP